MDTSSLSKTFAHNLFNLALMCCTKAKTDTCDFVIDYPGSGKIIASLHFKFMLPDTNVIPPKATEKKPAEFEISEEFKKDIVDLLKNCMSNNTTGCQVSYFFPKIGNHKDLTFITDIEFKMLNGNSRPFNDRR